MSYEIPVIRAQARWLERTSTFLSTVLIGGVLYLFETAELDEEGKIILEDQYVTAGIFLAIVSQLALAVAYKVENLRWCQVFAGFATTVMFIQSVIALIRKRDGETLQGKNTYSLIVYTTIALLAWSLILLVVYGEISYDRFQRTMLGKMGVGSKQFWTNQYGNFTVVSYPITKQQFKRAPWSQRMPFNLFGNDISHYLGKLVGWMAQVENRNSEDVKYFDHLVVPAIRNAEFDLATPGEEMKLIPVVFSHGIACTSSVYFSYQIELAANGYIVFALNHNDGSCVFTLDSQLSKIGMDCQEELESFAKRKKQLMIRQLEFSALIKEISEPNFLQDELGFPEGVSIDTDKLITLGHSLGGVTSIAQGVNNAKIRACCAFDPWYYPVSQEHSDFQISSSTPFFSVRTESFNKWCSFNITHATQKFFDRHMGVHKNFNSVVMGNSSHGDQTDSGFLIPLELHFLKFLLEQDVCKLELGGKAETVLSHLWLVMDFLISEGLSSSMTNVPAIQKKAARLYKRRAHKEVWEGKWEWKGQI